MQLFIEIIQIRNDNDYFKGFSNLNDLFQIFLAMIYAIERILKPEDEVIISGNMEDLDRLTTFSSISIFTAYNTVLVLSILIKINLYLRLFEG